MPQYWGLGLERLFGGDTIQSITHTSSYETRQKYDKNTGRSIKCNGSEALEGLREGFMVLETALGYDLRVPGDV